MFGAQVQKKYGRPNKNEMEQIKAVWKKYMAGITWHDPDRSKMMTKAQQEILVRTGYNVGVLSGSQVYFGYFVQRVGRTDTYKKEVFTHIGRGLTPLERERIEKYGTTKPTGEDVARTKGLTVKKIDGRGETVYTTPESTLAIVNNIAKKTGQPAGVVLENYTHIHRLTDPQTGRALTATEIVQKAEKNLTGTIADENITKKLSSGMIALIIVVLSIIIVIPLLIKGGK